MWDNKGLIFKKVLRELADKNGDEAVDFILCMGDDILDKEMLSVRRFFVHDIYR